MNRKNILILTPCLTPHGGVRVLVEWANYFASKGYHTVLHSVDDKTDRGILHIHEKVKVIGGHGLYLNGYDAIIAGTPWLADAISRVSTTAKKFYLLQMAEELFRPLDKDHYNYCIKSYFSGIPIMTTSRWVEYRLRQIGVNGPIHYVNPGVSPEFTPGQKDEAPTVLAPWQVGDNAAKDVQGLIPKALRVLKGQYPGLKVLGFGHKDDIDVDLYDEYYPKCGSEVLVGLYQRAWFTMQATLYDARSMTGLESMASATPIVRALRAGDDDLIHEYNCLRGDYSVETLISGALRILTDGRLLERLTEGCIEYSERNLSWDRNMAHLENIMSL